MLVRPNSESDADHASPWFSTALLSICLKISAEGESESSALRTSLAFSYADSMALLSRSFSSALLVKLYVVAARKADNANDPSANVSRMRRRSGTR